MTFGVEARHSVILLEQSTATYIYFQIRSWELFGVGLCVCTREGSVANAGLPALFGGWLRS